MLQVFDKKKIKKGEALLLKLRNKFNISIEPNAFQNYSKGFPAFARKTSMSNSFTLLGNV